MKSTQFLIAKEFEAMKRNIRLLEQENHRLRVKVVDQKETISYLEDKLLEGGQMNGLYKTIRDAKDTRSENN